LARLFETAEALTRAHLATLVGTRQRVLVEGESKAGAGKREGRTERNEIVHVEAPADREIVGQIVEVEVVRANKHSLEGTLTDAALASLPVRSTPSAPAPDAAPGRRALPVLAAG